MSRQRVEKGSGRSPAPVRAAKLIADLRDLGVGVKILTGDTLPVAIEIARRVGLSNVRRVDELQANAAKANTKQADCVLLSRLSRGAIPIVSSWSGADGAVIEIVATMP
jgi:magnesium-transporting ATPase (P-type)